MPVILGMAKDGNEMENRIQFAWMNQEYYVEETTLPSAWNELLLLDVRFSMDLQLITDFLKRLKHKDMYLT